MPPDFPQHSFFFSRCGLRLRRLALPALVATTLSACALGPDYQRPPPPVGTTTAAFREDAGWKVAAPGQVDALLPWWAWYGDPVLNQLVEQANAANPSLAVVAAQFRQAQALVQGAQSAGRPTLGVTGGASRALTDTNGVREGNAHNWSLQAGWEPDLWGHVSRSVEAAQATAQASSSDLAAARLSVQAALVNSYVQLRLDDALLAMYARSVAAYEKALSVTESQHKWGVATVADVSLAAATLNAARAQATDLGLARKQLEHALATLLGKTPAEFSVAALADPLAGLPGIPALPAVLPSALLERRPDIAAAERRMAAANANIGVAQSAWFPKLTLSATDGNSGAGLGNWLAAPFRVWALGAQVAASLYDGGLKAAQDQQAQAALDVAAASYRQTVLAGFQEVEDNLAALNDLARERVQQDAAVAAAQTAERVLMSQYRAGTAPYLSVVTAQALTLTNQRAALQVRGRQLTASVTLIKATGGGWPLHQD